MRKTKKKTVFIEVGESFIIRSIVTNLEGMDLPCVVLKWTVDELQKNKSGLGDIVVAYIEDINTIDQKAMNYLRDTCMESGRRLYFMGHSDDIEYIKTTYSVSNVAGEFHRPINAKQVAEQISNLIEDGPVKNKNHVLVVDDSGTMLNTIQEWLGDKYRVSVVNSAMNAISFLSKSTPDLILLDYEMPGCSGAQLLEMLRADSKTSGIPVIFLTGKDDPESVKRVLTLKPAGYLLKTMPKDYIIKQVDDFFDRKGK